jgi:(4-O-methyl)-D-glucuronate---lignin esterase
MRRIAAAAGVLLLVSVGGLFGCVAARLPNVPLTSDGASAQPPVLDAFEDDPPVSSMQDWTNRRAPLLREAFQALIYGRWPEPEAASVAQRQVLDGTAFGAAGTIEQWDVVLGETATGRGFSMLVILPADARGPVPIIIMQNFCGNVNAYPEIAGVAAPRHGAPRECGSDFARPIIRAIFGDSILAPPTARILSAGYGVAMFYAGDVVPDDAAAAPSVLSALTPPGAPPAQTTGAVAAWAWLYLRALDALSADPRIDAQRVVLWGHSRNAKAALLAAAMDPRPAAVIALQAGTAGASLGRDDVGESIAEITQTYPYWFAPAYAAYADRQADLPVDQHQLLALIAPRPVLLEGARRDRWSDPQGAFRAAEGAAPVYSLAGAPLFSQTDLREPDYGNPLVTYMRPGLHGVHSRDWDVALAFLDARLDQAQ